MSPFLLILFSICGIIFYGNGLPYQNIFSKYPDANQEYYGEYYDDYYDNYYYYNKKVPKLRTNSDSKYSVYNNLAWFPENIIKKQKEYSDVLYGIQPPQLEPYFPLPDPVFDPAAVPEPVPDPVPAPVPASPLRTSNYIPTPCPEPLVLSIPEPYPSFSRMAWEFDMGMTESTQAPPRPTQKCHNIQDVRNHLKNKFKNFSIDHRVSKNWRKFKQKSSSSIRKMKSYLKQKNIKEAFRNFTHPLRYRGSKNIPNDPQWRQHANNENCDYISARIRIHPKSSHVEVIRGSSTTTIAPFTTTTHATTTTSTTEMPTVPPLFNYHFAYPRKIKVIIDTDAPEKPSKLERNVNDKSYTSNIEGEANNSTNVLETAGEMASDLAGRVTSLWHCVLGSHHIPETRDVKFYLYTRRNIIIPELLKVNYDLISQKVRSSPPHVDIDCIDLAPDQIGDFERIPDDKREIIKSNFLNLNAPTKILIHGYTGSYKDSRMSKIKDAYLKNGRYNVIQVDWELLAAPPCYIRVTHHSKFVGETIAQFLNGLYLVGLNMSLVHLVGFSLGAQVAGFAGNNSTITPLCRITGLDPALPLFLHTQPSGHLDRLDAKFVDVIHTCGGILAMLDPLGHVDFYPNGGTRQPGCEFSNLKCSHSRAPQYFAESVISQKKFTGQLCLTWEEYVAGDCNNTTDTSYMGEPCSRRSVFGKYYLLTKSKEPFVL